MSFGWQCGLAAIAAFAISLVITRQVQRQALRRGMLDVPNARSSHSIPTPRGGGLAIVVAVAVVVLFAFLTGTAAGPVALALAGAIPVAAVGLWDDYRSVPPLLRLLVHVLAATWAMWWVGGLPPLQIGQGLAGFGPAAPLLGIIGIIWVLNLFNFMDGIDGIAGAEATFMGLAGGALALLEPASPGLALLCFGFAAANAGFLVWNWPPARIFMGDVGSGAVGYLIAVLAVMAGFADPVGLWVWLILGGTFFVDATVTLGRRLMRGEKPYEAHRSHVYQRLSRAWGSHGRVSLAVTAVNLLWLLPWAVAAKSCRPLAGWFALAALVPLLLLALLLGAGKAETPR